MFAKPVRGIMKPIIMLWGGPASGKTCSSLIIGTGIAKQVGGKVALLDLEDGRASHYSDLYDDWLMESMDPPYTARKTIDSISNAKLDDEISVLIIDSLSQLWEGEGGALDDAEEMLRKNPRDGLSVWRRVKSAFNEILSAARKSNLYIILTVRAKQSVDIKPGYDKKNDLTSPAMEKGVLYKCDFAILLGTDFRPVTSRDDGGIALAPGIPPYKTVFGMEGIFSTGKPVTEKTGRDIALWSEGDSDNIVRFREDALRKATEGREAFKLWFNSLNKNKKIVLNSISDRISTTLNESDSEPKAMKE